MTGTTPLLLFEKFNNDLMTQFTEFDKMNKRELKDLFIRVVDYLKTQGYTQRKQAQLIQDKYFPGKKAGWMESRYRNIRSKGAPVVQPTPFEVEKIFEYFEKNLTNFEMEVGGPSPVELKLNSLEDRIKYLEELGKTKEEYLMRIIANLKLELKKYEK